jgi:hypothetical protein
MRTAGKSDGTAGCIWCIYVLRTHRLRVDGVGGEEGACSGCEVRSKTSHRQTHPREEHRGHRVQGHVARVEPERLQTAQLVVHPATHKHRRTWITFAYTNSAALPAQNTRARTTLDAEFTF